MKTIKFAAVIGGAMAASYLAMMLLPFPLLILLGNIALFGCLSVLPGDHIHRPSLVLCVALVTVLLGIIVYPRVLAFRADTPEEHLKAAWSLGANWRTPFSSELAAWPHYMAAAEGGIAHAELVVGMAYLYRHFDVPRDRTQARRWLESATSHGSHDAQRELANVDSVP